MNRYIIGVLLTIAVVAIGVRAQTCAEGEESRLGCERCEMTCENYSADEDCDPPCSFNESFCLCVDGLVRNSTNGLCVDKSECSGYESDEECETDSGSDCGSDSESESDTDTDSESDSESETVTDDGTARRVRRRHRQRNCGRKGHKHRHHRHRHDRKCPKGTPAPEVTITTEPPTVTTETPGPIDDTDAPTEGITTSPDGLIEGPLDDDPSDRRRRGSGPLDGSRPTPAGSPHTHRPRRTRPDRPRSRPTPNGEHSHPTPNGEHSHPTPGGSRPSRPPRPDRTRTHRHRTRPTVDPVP